MKKLITLFITLSICISTFAVGICGNGAISSGTKTYDKSSGVGITSGSIYYDATNKKMTLKSVVINASAKNCIYIDKDMTVILEGTSSLLSYDSNTFAIDKGAKVTIQSTTDGILNIESKATGSIVYYGIWVNESNLTISDCTINSKSQKGTGIGGYKTSSITTPGSTLAINYANVTTNGNGTVAAGGYPSIWWFKNVTINGSEITSPSGANFSTTSHGSVDSSNKSYYGELKIAQIKYPIYIAGIQVTAKNVDAVTGSGISGKVYYQPTGHSLILNGATIKGGSNKGIEVKNSIKDLNVYVYGNNVVESTGSDAIDIRCEGYVDILDNNHPSTMSTLKVTTTSSTVSSNAIFAYNNLSIGNVKITATASKNDNAIRGNGVLAVTNAEIQAKSSKSAIFGFKSASLSDSYIEVPNYGFYNESIKGVSVNKSSSTATPAKDATIKIGTRYPISVNGTVVTSNNSSNVLGDGKITFNKYSNYCALTFTNASYSTTKDFIHVYPECNYEVDVLAVGNCSIKSTNSPIYCEAPIDLWIRSKGDIAQDKWTLETTDNVNNNAAMYMLQGNVVFSSTSAILKSAMPNGVGAIRGAGSLSVWGSNVIISSPYMAVSGITKVDYSHAYQNTPEICSFIANEKTFKSNNNYAKELTFRRGYGIRVNGTDITSTNRSNVDGSSKISYDPNTNVLKLNNCNILNSTTPGLWIKKNDLKIELVGTNSITKSNDQSCIWGSFDGTLTFKGTGTLNLNNTSTGNGTNIFPGCVQFEECTVNVKTTNGGTALYAASGVVVNHANVTANSNGKRYSINGQLTLKDSEISSPSGAKINGEKDVVDANGNVIKTEVVIKKADYNLWIAGTQVTSKNASNIMSGVKYDRATKTLTLTNANITASGSSTSGIQTNEDLTIKLVGNNTVKSTSSAIMSSNANVLNIVGTSDATTLEATSSNTLAVYAHDGDVTIKNCYLTAKGSSYGIAGDAKSQKLTIDGATVVCPGTVTDAQIKDFNSMSFLNDSQILSPSGASFASSKNAVVDNAGNILKGQLMIGKSFNIEVAGIKVGTPNAGDILGDGKVKYDAATSTLLLNNATINAPKSEYGIYAGIPITIALIGKNTITTNNDYCIQTSKNSVIQSAVGSSAVLNCSTNSYAIVPFDNTLTIKNCTVNAETSSNYAIWGNGNKGTLAVNNANLTLKAKMGAASMLKNATLTGCYVDTPIGATFSTSKNSFVDSNNSIITEMAIKAGAEPDRKAPTLPSDATIKASNLTTVSADLSWQAASDDRSAASKIKYNVYYRVEGETAFKLASAVTGAVKCTISGLNQNTSYEVSVIAVDEAGNESATYTIGKFKTEKAADVKAPTLPADKTIAVSNITPTSADLKWSAASDEETPTDKLSYTISVTKKGTSVSNIAGTVVGKTEFALTGLEQNTEYEIDVCATDEAGNSKYYTMAEIKTTKLPDTSAPVIADANITVSNITDSSFEISWEPATDNETSEANMKYSVSYKGEGGWTIVDMTGVTSCTITGLDASTAYTIKVSATDEAGNISNYIDYIAETDKAADTVAPTVTNPEIVLTNADVDRLEIRWDAASDNETLDINLVYKIEFKKATEDTWTSLYSDFTFFTIEALDQDTEYDVKVSVADEAGNVTEYTAAKFKTILPDAIESILANNPDVKMYNTSGVLVNKNYKGVVIINGKKYMKK